MIRETRFSDSKVEMLELCEIYAKYQIKELLVTNSDVTPS